MAGPINEIKILAKIWVVTMATNIIAMATDNLVSSRTFRGQSVVLWFNIPSKSLCLFKIHVNLWMENCLKNGVLTIGPFSLSRSQI